MYCIKLKLILSVILISAVSGCGIIPFTGQEYDAPVVDGYGPPSSNFSSDKGKQIFNLARKFIGTPYRYGGHDPAGFDCSGLVEYTHRRAGIHVPRSTKSQYAKARHINLRELTPGDVIFFRQSYRRISHVGIYAGNGDFIHAPKSGRHVSIANLAEPYWRERLVTAGRLY